MEYFYYFNGEKWLIGSSHNNWAFFLMINKVRDLVEWKKLFAKPGSYIKNANGITISPDEMEMIITARNGNIVQSRANIRSYGSNRVFTGNHDLSHITPECCLGCVRCVANEDCWDLCMPE